MLGVQKWSYDELEFDRIEDRKTMLFFTISDTIPAYNFIVALAFWQGKL